MDVYQVPKKVNRHVLKAINFLSSNGHGSSVTVSQIINQVENQMKNLVPVPNIEIMVQKSLKNLSDVGLINRAGHKRYSVSSQPILNEPLTKRNLLQPSGSRKRASSSLDPNSKRNMYDSEDSLSDDDYVGPVKRLRTNNKKVVHDGRQTQLPKSRHHKNLSSRKSTREAALETDSLEHNLYFGVPADEFPEEACFSDVIHSQPVVTEILYTNTNNVFTKEQPIETRLNVVGKSQSFTDDDATNSYSENTSNYSKTELLNQQHNSKSSITSQRSQKSNLTII